MALYKVSADGKGNTDELLPYYKYDILNGMSVCDTRFYGNHLFLWITKLDGTAKGGVVIGISDQFKIPVKYIGLGEGIEDLQIFRRREFVDSLFGTANK